MEVVYSAYTMRIILDSRLLLPQMTGLGRYLLGLGRGFGQLDDDFQVEMWLQRGLPPGHPVWGLERGPVQFRRVDLPHMSLQAQWRLPLALLRAQRDLLHYPHFDLPFLAPGPLAATLHDLKYITRPDFFPRLGRARRLVMLAMMRSTVRKARRVIVVSDSTRRDAIRWLGARPEKLRVIYEGVEEPYFQPAPPEQTAAVRRRYGLEGEPFILFLGERRPHKNIPGLLRAFAHLRRMTSRPYTLAVAGKPYADYREPERLAEQLGLNAAVRFIDRLPDADLPALYQSASAFALLSRYEGFGLPILEAMAGGAPVLASDVTSLPEVVGSAGLCVSPDDPQIAAEALLTLLEDEAQRQTCIAAGKARARQFTWQRCARQTLEVYRECL